MWASVYVKYIKTEDRGADLAACRTANIRLCLLATLCCYNTLPSIKLQHEWVKDRRPETSSRQKNFLATIRTLISVFEEVTRLIMNCVIVSFWHDHPVPARRPWKLCQGTQQEAESGGGWLWDEEGETKRAPLVRVRYGSEVQPQGREAGQVLIPPPPTPWTCIVLHYFFWPNTELSIMSFMSIK